MSEDLNVILILKRFRGGQSRHLGGGGSLEKFQGGGGGLKKTTLYIDKSSNNKVTTGQGDKKKTECFNVLDCFLGCHFQFR